MLREFSNAHVVLALDRLGDHLRRAPLRLRPSARAYGQAT